MDNNDAVIGIGFLVFCGVGIVLCLLLLSASIAGFTRATARIWYDEQKGMKRKYRKAGRKRA